jgi:hypothetical protein
MDQQSCGRERESLSEPQQNEKQWEGAKPEYHDHRTNDHSASSNRVSFDKAQVRR